MGRKFINDEFGGYWVDNASLGEEQVTEIEFEISNRGGRKWLEAALRKSPPEAIKNHLVHLSKHKILGTDLGSRAQLLADYIEGLKDVPEFILWLVCKAFWEDNASTFMPKIVEIKNEARKIQERFEHALQLLEPAKEPVAQIAAKPEARIQFKRRKDWTEQDWREALMKGAQNIAGWQEAVDKQRPGAAFFLKEAREDYEGLKAECPKEFA